MNLERRLQSITSLLYSQVFLFSEIKTKKALRLEKKKRKCNSVMDLGYYNFILNSSVAIFAKT